MAPREGLFDSDLGKQVFGQSEGVACVAALESGDDRLGPLKIWQAHGIAHGISGIGDEGC